MNIKITLEYNGAAFSGWQEQAGIRTIQGELEGAMTVFLASEYKKLGKNYSDKSLINGSGRTDAGVHAKGQVANIMVPDDIGCSPERLRSALNGITSNDIVITSCEQVADDFDARHAPHIKCYSYKIMLEHHPASFYSTHYWCVPQTLDIKAMIAAVGSCVGEHDFSSFRASDCTAKSTVRTIVGAELTRLSKYELCFSILGKGFLKQMVRILAGTFVEVGMGQRSPENIVELFTLKSREHAGKTAPASGLTLEWVRYL